LVFSTFAQQNNWPFGGAVSFVLMTATIILTVAASLLVQRRYR
jgi:putative spermidine/putrescine transport system permease protein